MRWRPSTLASALSMALLLATVGMWARSYRACDSVWCGFRSCYVWLGYGSGFVELQLGYVRGGADSGYGSYRPASGGTRSGWGFRHARFETSSGSVVYTSIDTWSAPFWSLLPLLLLPPACSLLFRRSGELGVCRSCGYDLRATPHRCPECGTIASGRRFSA